MTALIVGGGVIGGAIAWELLQRGIPCTIVEKGVFGGEATTASAGMLCPQAEILDGSYPSELFVKSQSLHREWTEALEECSHIPVDFVNRGMLRVAGTEEQASALRDMVRTAQTDVAWLTPDDVLAMEPDVSQDTQGGIWFPHDASLHPVQLSKSLRRALLRSGCVLKECVPVSNILVEGGRVVGVHTAEGDLYADIVILASGAWTSALLRPLGVEMPVHPVKGQLYAVRSDDLSIQRTIQGPDGMIIPRLDGTFTVGVTHLEAGYDKRPTVDGIAEIYQGVVQFIPKLKNASFVTTWAGLRPGTPDGLPYIGAVKEYENLWVASGHYTTGIFLSRITGILMGQLLCGEEPIVNPLPFSPQRFGEKRVSN